MNKVVQFHNAQRLTPAEEERMRQRSEAPRPPTDYERKLEQMCKAYVLSKRNKK